MLVAWAKEKKKSEEVGKKFENMYIESTDGKKIVAGKDVKSTTLRNCLQNTWMLTFF